VPTDLDTFVEAELLLAAVDGLQTAVVLGQRSVEQTITLVDHMLDRLFTA
jgi:hypothetical protein